jgi:hypothetical protein
MAAAIATTQDVLRFIAGTSLLIQPAKPPSALAQTIPLISSQ